MKIGVIALQGAVQPHLLKLEALGVMGHEVRTPQEAHGLDGLILPGGESSTMIKLLKYNELWDFLLDWEKPLLGVCAGAILMAKEVVSPTQESLAKIEVKAIRNAYGRQLESFESELDTTTHWKEYTEDPPPRGVFIRAPQFQLLGEKVRVLLTHNQLPVLVEQGNFLAGVFHPELSDSESVHAHFLKKCSTLH